MVNEGRAEIDEAMEQVRPPHGRPPTPTLPLVLRLVARSAAHSRAGATLSLPTPPPPSCRPCTVQKGTVLEQECLPFLAALLSFNTYPCTVQKGTVLEQECLSSRRCCLSGTV